MDVRLTETSNGEEVALAVGENFTIALPESPTTGFRWEFTKTGAPLCELLRDSFDADSQQIGGSGTHEWRFRADAPGTATIQMELTRGWDPKIATHSLTLHLHVTLRPNR